MGTAFRVIHHTTKGTRRAAKGQDLLGGATLRGWARSSLLFGDPAAGVTTITYEGKGARGGDVCRLRVLGTSPDAYDRSFFRGLEWMPVRGSQAANNRESSSGAVQAVPAGSRPLTPLQHQAGRLLCQQPRTSADLQAAGITRRTSFEVLAALRARDLAIKLPDGHWEATPALREMLAA
jgi:hypothetical protein